MLSKTQKRSQIRKDLGLCWKCENPAKENRIRCQYHLDRQNIRAKAYNLEIKKDCVEAYGGKCSCCKESILDFLTIDHISGGGNQHRKELFGRNIGGQRFYRWLKNQGYPQEEFQLLCMNCNFGYRISGMCPHQQSVA